MKQNITVFLHQIQFFNTKYD